MAVELERLRLDRLYATAEKRLAEADADPADAFVPFEEMPGEEGYRSFLEIDPDEVPDEELFA